MSETTETTPAPEPVRRATVRRYRGAELHPVEPMHGPNVNQERDEPAAPEPAPTRAPRTKGGK